MGLYETQNDLKKCARKLPQKYESYSINELADNYCKALDENDENNKNIYSSALILRFWYVIDRIYQNVKVYGYDREDCFFKLFDCINIACSYRAWQDASKNTNAQACINQVIASRGAAMMAYEAKHQKNNRPSLSLDEPLDDESETTRGDLIEDTVTEQPGLDGAYDMVQSLIYQNKIVEAIITDNIAYKDVFKHDKRTVKNVDSETGEVYRYSKCSSEFWPFKLVQELNSLDETYLTYFTDTYSISKDKLKLAFEDVQKANNQKKYKFISKTLDTLRVSYAD